MKLFLMTCACVYLGCGGATAATGAEERYAGPVRSTDVALGADKYAAVCARCHENGAPQLANLGWSAARIRAQVREGSGRMRPIPEPRLSNEDLEALLAHLTTIGTLRE